MESQTNNNLQIGSTVIPNVVYGAAFNKLGAPDTIIPAQTYVYVGTKDGANAFTEASDADKKGANWNVENVEKKLNLATCNWRAVVFLKSHWQTK